MPEDRVVGGIRCGQVLAKLSAFLDGELPAEEVAQVREHVGGCDWCERFGGEFAAAVTALRDQREEAGPAHVRARILDATRH